MPNSKDSRSSLRNITDSLDLRKIPNVKGVPGSKTCLTLSLWGRIQIYASDYLKYKKDNLDLELANDPSSNLNCFFIPQSQEPSPSSTQGINKPRLSKKDWDLKQEQKILLDVQRIIDSSSPNSVSPVVTKPLITLSEDQTEAWSKINKWLEPHKKRRFFVLQGVGGSGKTTLLRMLVDKNIGALAKSVSNPKSTTASLSESINFLFCAPTNKAAKVLSDTVKVRATTIHSLLGLKMETNDDGKQELVYSKKNSLRRKPYPGEEYTGVKDFSLPIVLVIDESSMLSEEITSLIEEAASEDDFKVLFVGDPYQLPPIGEKTSKCWSLVPKEKRSVMTQVMRFDNQILDLSIRIRKAIRRKIEPTILDNNDEKEGVFVLSQRKFERTLLAEVETTDFTKTKVLAWRNKTVDRYNKLIRDKLGRTEPFCEGDAIVFTAPLYPRVDGTDKETQVVGSRIAHTDDEGVVKSVKKAKTKITLSSEYVNIDERISIWELVVDIEGVTQTIQVCQEESDLQKILSTISSAASKIVPNRNSSAREAGVLSGKRRDVWKQFWAIKNSFAQTKYGYSLTIHRSQGSTYHTTFIDSQDILVNSNEREAKQCLYVACTRASTRLFTF